MLNELMIDNHSYFKEFLVNLEWKIHKDNHYKLVGTLIVEWKSIARIQMRWGYLSFLASLFLVLWKCYEYWFRTQAWLCWEYLILASFKQCPRVAAFFKRLVTYFVGEIRDGHTQSFLECDLLLPFGKTIWH